MDSYAEQDASRTAAATPAVTRTLRKRKGVQEQQPEEVQAPPPQIAQLPEVSPPKTVRRSTRKVANRSKCTLGCCEDGNHGQTRAENGTAVPLFRGLEGELGEVGGAESAEQPSPFLVASGPEIDWSKMGGKRSNVALLSLIVLLMCVVPGLLRMAWGGGGGQGGAQAGALAPRGGGDAAAAAAANAFLFPAMGLLSGRGRFGFNAAKKQATPRAAPAAVPEAAAAAAPATTSAAEEEKEEDSTASAAPLLHASPQETFLVVLPDFSAPIPSNSAQEAASEDNETLTSPAAASSPSSLPFRVVASVASSDPEKVVGELLAQAAGLDEAVTVDNATEAPAPAEAVVDEPSLPPPPAAADSAPRPPPPSTGRKVLGSGLAGDLRAELVETTEVLYDEMSGEATSLSKSYGLAISTGTVRLHPLHSRMCASVVAAPSAHAGGSAASLPHSAISNACLTPSATQLYAASAEAHGSDSLPYAFALEGVAGAGGGGAGGGGAGGGRAGGTTVFTVTVTVMDMRGRMVRASFKAPTPERSEEEVAWEAWMDQQRTSSSSSSSSLPRMPLEGTGEGKGKTHAATTQQELRLRAVW